MVKLSIIVPVYNVADYIRHCLGSLKEQGIPSDEYEILIVDDCSEDDSILIARQMINDYSNMRIISLPNNRRLGGARNAGLSEARGKYVMFVDSDDYLLPNVIGKLLFEVSRLELDFLIFDYIIAEKGGHISHSLPSESSIREGSDMFLDPDFPWWEEQVVAWRKIYRTDFLRKNEINFAEGVMYEDNDFAIKAYACAQRVKYYPVSAYVYRVNHQSFTRKRPSSAHIKYHIDLCWRLIALKEWIVSSGKDERFVPLIDSFVRSELRIATETARGLLPEEKQISKGILRSSLSSDLRRYMGRRLICKLSLGLI